MVSEQDKYTQQQEAERKRREKMKFENKMSDFIRVCSCRRADDKDRIRLILESIDEVASRIVT